MAKSTTTRKSTATAGHQDTSEVALPKEAPGASEPSPAPRTRTIRYTRGQGSIVQQVQPVISPAEAQKLSDQVDVLSHKYEAALQALDDPIKPILVVLRQHGHRVRNFDEALALIEDLAARRRTVETALKAAAAGGLRGL